MTPPSTDPPHVGGTDDVSPTPEADGTTVDVHPERVEAASTGAAEEAGPAAATQPQPTVIGHPDDRSCSVELPQFEGPLDLLLHLVRRHELDILDIPIAFVCEKYLEYLGFMQALDLEIAGDYLVMAATLAYLKSRELVPSAAVEEEETERASDEDGPDPRQELIARLLEYQTYRAAASELDRLPVSGRDVFDRGGGVELPPVDPGLAPITLFRLAEAYHRVLDRARIHKSHEVVLETVSVPQRMQQLTLLLVEEPRREFESLFLSRTWSSEAELRSMLVVTLMSILELTKLGIIYVHQLPESDVIVLERRATPEEAQELLSAYQAEARMPLAADEDDMDDAEADSESHA